MLALVQSHIDFLASARSSLEASGQWSSTLVAHTVKLQQNLRNLGTKDLSDAALAMNALSKGCFDLDQQQSIAATINGVVSEPSIAAESRITLKQQDHTSFEAYMTDADWATLTDHSVDINDKIEVIVLRAVSIGLLSMTEKTAQHIAAVFIVAAGLSCTASTSYEILQSIKLSFKKMRQQRTATCRPTLSSFPADVTIFTSQFPGCYDKPPVPSRIDQKSITKAKAVIACRKSNALVRDSQPTPRQSSPMNSLVAAMAPLLQAMLSNNVHGMSSSLRRARSSDQLTLSMECPPSPPSKDGNSQSSQSLGMLALADGDAGVSPQPASKCGLSAASLASTPPQSTAKGISAAAAAVAEAIGAKKSAKKNRRQKAKSNGKGKSAGKTAGKTAAEELSTISESEASYDEATTKAKAKAKLAKKGTSKAKAKAKSKTKTKPKETAKSKSSRGGGGLILGCGKCRGCPAGCAQCRDPDFTGKRWKRS